jgi:hypothetical protein
MNAIAIPAKLEQRTSKGGNQYICLVVEIAPEVEKLVFLDKAEIALINLTYGKQNIKLQNQQ